MAQNFIISVWPLIRKFWIKFLVPLKIRRIWHRVSEHWNSVWDSCVVTTCLSIAQPVFHIFMALVSATVPWWFLSTGYTPHSISCKICSWLLRHADKTPLQWRNLGTEPFPSSQVLHHQHTSTGSNMHAKRSSHKSLFWKVIRRKHSDKDKLYGTQQTQTVKHFCKASWGLQHIFKY